MSDLRYSGHYHVITHVHSCAVSIAACLQHGYRLPETDEDIFYVQVYFRTFPRTIFTYPFCYTYLVFFCATSNGKPIVKARHYSGQ